MDTNSFVLTLLNMKGWGPSKVFKYVEKNSFDYEQCVLGLVNVLDDEEKILFKKELVKSKIKIKNNNDLGINCCNIFDSVFPSKLYNYDQKCVFLYYRGDINLLKMKSITIIGSRSVNEYFSEKGKIATKYFAENDIVIVSGLAIGSDSIAHQACLDVNGKTIAVLPSSCKDIVPYCNTKLANEIVENGGLLISEYGVNDVFNKFNYAQRDRIQSLLSNVTLIITATDDSGTMIATKKSIANKKPVYAIEGNNLKIVNRYVNVDNIEELNEIAIWV